MLSQLLKTPLSPKEHPLPYLGQDSELKLRLSELRYRRLFETAQDGILILDATSGKIADANPFIKEILGYSQTELLGKELWQIGVFKDIKDSKRAFLELQEAGYIRYKDLPLQRKDGRSIDVEFVSNVYMVDKQQVIQCNIRDITDRRKAEDALKSKTEDLERLNKSQEAIKQAMLNVMEDLEDAKRVIELEKVKDEAMLASIGDGLIAVDTNKKIMIINKAAERMLGWRGEEMIGKELTCIPLELEDGQRVSIDRVKRRDETYFFVRKDTTRFPIAIIITPIKLNGRTIGAIDIFRDITREREIDRAKNEFVSLASHQLRTPLGIAKWYIEALREEGYLDTAPEIAKDYLNEIYKSNERLLALVRDLLSISRIDQGKVRDTPTLTNIIDLIKTVMKAMSIIAAKENISLVLHVKKSETIILFIDHLRLQEVIENLIANAIAYSQPHKIVEIIVAKQDNRVLISIKDTGIGIADADKKKLFTKFYRSERAIAKNTEGSGLGLYLVKTYIQGWHGEISVVSEEEKGATFTISLPMKKKV